MENNFILSVQIESEWTEVKWWVKTHPICGSVMYWTADMYYIERKAKIPDPWDHQMLEVDLSCQRWLCREKKSVIIHSAFLLSTWSFTLSHHLAVGVCFQNVSCNSFHSLWLYFIHISLCSKQLPLSDLHSVTAFTPKSVIFHSTWLSLKHLTFHLALK